MDDWDSSRKPWMLYVAGGIIVIATIAITAAWAMSRFAQSRRHEIT
jgi:hypothetical protein